MLGEFERVLTNPAFKLIPRHLESTLGPDLRHLQVPRALVYVVDAHVARPAAGALLSNILDHYTEARIIVVAEKFDSEETYSLLQMGAKGLLTYDEAREQLPRALPLVANGGFWVPRAVLSGFVDSILNGSHSRRLKADASADLSRREQEVLNSSAGKSGQQRDWKQAEHLRTHREISRLELAQQVWSPSPGRSHPALLSKTQRSPVRPSLLPSHSSFRKARQGQNCVSRGCSGMGKLL